MPGFGKTTKWHCAEARATKIMGKLKHAPRGDKLKHVLPFGVDVGVRADVAAGITVTMGVDQVGAL